MNAQPKRILQAHIFFIALFLIIVVVGVIVPLGKPSLDIADLYEPATTVVFTVGEITSPQQASQQTSSQTLHEILSQMQKAGEISFSGKEYPGLGFFVTDIGELHQGSGKYLVYYVNGVESSLGVSAFIPKAGDVIEWKLQ